MRRINLEKRRQLRREVVALFCCAAMANRKSRGFRIVVFLLWTSVFAVGNGVNNTVAGGHILILQHLTRSGDIDLVHRQNDLLGMNKFG